MISLLCAERVGFEPTRAVTLPPSKRAHLSTLPPLQIAKSIIAKNISNARDKFPRKNLQKLRLVPDGDNKFAGNMITVVCVIGCNRIKIVLMGCLACCIIEA